MRYFELYSSVSIVVFVLMFLWARRSEDAQKWSDFSRGFVTILAALAWPLPILILVVTAVGRLSVANDWKSPRK